MPAPFSVFRPVPATALLFAFVAGCAALLYAWWGAPVVEMERLLRDDDPQQALQASAAAERRLGRFAVSRFLFARQYSAAIHNQLALSYRAGDYDAVVEKAASAPASAVPQFWSGLALLRLGEMEGYADRQVVWFTRAHEELRRALDAAPGDWDVKYNYEIAARIVTELRRQPKKRIDNPMQLLRPQPAQGTPTKKVG